MPGNLVHQIHFIFFRQAVEPSSGLWDKGNADPYGQRQYRYAGGFNMALFSGIKILINTAAVVPACLIGTSLQRNTDQ